MIYPRFYLTELKQGIGPGTIGDGILLFVMAVLFCCGTWEANKSQDDCFSIRNSTLIRGIAALNVVLCHLSLFYKGKVLSLFYSLGNASVGLFFFLSGYGLMIQYLNKADYRCSFLKKRLTKIAIPYLIVTLLYWAFFFFSGERMSLAEVLSRFWKGDPIASYSWYMIAIITIYLFFYLFMFVCGQDKKKMILCNAILYLSLFYVYKKLGYAPYWRFSLHMYLIGVIWAVYRSSCERLLRQNKALIAALSLLISILTFGKEQFYFLFEISLLLLIAVFFLRFSYKNAFLAFSGKISMEIYLIHGLVIKSYRLLLSDGTQLFHVPIILVLIYLSAYLLHLLFTKLLSLRPVRS